MFDLQTSKNPWHSCEIITLTINYVVSWELVWAGSRWLPVGPRGRWAGDWSTQLYRHDKTRARKQEPTPIETYSYTHVITSTIKLIQKLKQTWSGSSRTPEQIGQMSSSSTSPWNLLISNPMFVIFTRDWQTSVRCVLAWNFDYL